MTSHRNFLNTNLTSTNLMIGSNDTAGGSPHRHLTIDGNGRTHTIARIEQSPTINSKLDAITTALTPTYENTALTTSSMSAVNSTSSSIDMLGFKNLNLVVSQVATAGNSSLSNINIEFSLDDTNWFNSQSYISLNEVGTGGNYNNSVSIKEVGFRYVRLIIIEIVGNPTSTSCSLSRSL